MNVKIGDQVTSLITLKPAIEEGHTYVVYGYFDREEVGNTKIDSIVVESAEGRLYSKEYLDLYQVPEQYRSKKLILLFCGEYDVIETLSKSNGMSCTRCKNFSPYAGSNQSDGTFKCWSCRN